MASGKTLYIKGDRDVEVTKPDVTLADLLSMECSDQSLLPKLKTMKILKFKKTGNQRCVISVLKIIACIHGQYPDMEVQNLGETRYDRNHTKIRKHRLMHGILQKLPL